MFGKSIFLRNEAFERENFSLALKIVRRRRAIFLQSGRCGVSPLEGVAKNAARRLERGGNLPHQKNRADLLTNWIFEFIFSAQVCSL